MLGNIFIRAFEAIMLDAGTVKAMRTAREAERKARRDAVESNELQWRLVQEQIDRDSKAPR